MTVGEFAQRLGMKVKAGQSGLGREITGMYAGDLLSWVMSRANSGDAWVTVLTSINVVAVGLMTEVACVILPEDINMEEPVLKRADQEDLPVLSSSLTSYQICCKAHEILDHS